MSRNMSCTNMHRLAKSATNLAIKVPISYSSKLQLLLFKKKKKALQFVTLRKRGSFFIYEDSKVSRELLRHFTKLMPPKSINARIDILKSYTAQGI